MPTATRTELGNESRKCVNDLIDIRSVLWPEKAPKGSDEIHTKLETLLEEKLSEAPKGGKGPCRRQFLQHLKRVYESYAPGLFHCYDKKGITQTTNELEGKHGGLKHHARKTSGRASTAGGPIETMGELVAVAVDTVKRLGFRKLSEAMLRVGHQAYEAARRKLAEIREFARRYRSIQRNPQKALNETVATWEAVAI